MIHFAITAGGTSENLDGIRRITNTSTGSLGWHCLEAIFDAMHQRKVNDFRIHYLLTDTAIRKELSEEQKPFVEFIPVSDAESVYTAVDQLTKKVAIDYFIHSMAVSDFTFGYAVSVDALAREIAQIAVERTISESVLNELLENPQSQFRKNEKIPSDENLILGMKKTKKVIPLIKRNRPKTILVGFKLLNEVSEEKLLEAAKKLSEQNECDWVFANEASHISEQNHRGILIKGDEIVDRPEGKANIAASIVRNMLQF